MKKTFSLITYLTLFYCFGENKATFPSQSQPQTGLKTIKIISATPEDGFLKLAAQEFASSNKDIKLQLKSADGSSAMKQLLHGQIDLVLIDNPQRLRSRVVLKVVKPYAAVVNPQNILENIPFSKLRKIYAGQLHTWDELGGAKTPIRLIGYRNDSPEGILLQHILKVKLKKTPFQILASTGRGVCALTASAPHALGCLPMAYTNKNVKVLKVGGVSPDRQNIISGEYKLVATIYLLGDNLSPEAEKFVQFLKGKAGKRILHYLSLIPIKQSGSKK